MKNKILLLLLFSLAVLFQSCRDQAEEIKEPINQSKNLKTDVVNDAINSIDPSKGVDINALPPS